MIAAGPTTLRFASALSDNADTEAAVRDAADAIQAQMGQGPIDLLCAFFSAHHASKAELIAALLADELPATASIGCTGEGIIAGDLELETSAALTLWAARLPAVQLTPLRLSFSPVQDRFSMAGWPECGPDPGTFLLFADPFTTPMQNLLSVLEDRYGRPAAIGGMAGGGHDAGEDRLICNGEVYDDGLVGVRIQGPLSIRTVISQGCRPIGERYVVTKAEHNLIHELGGAPALQRLQAVFESLPAEARRHAHRALHLGIVIDEHRERFGRGDFLVRNLIGADQTTGSVAVGDLLQEGQTVQFHLRDARSASEDLGMLLAEDAAKHRTPPRAALLFSCCGRGQGLFRKPNHDVCAVRERLGDIPVAGFFAQGEIGPVGGRNFLHGYTASIALFCDVDPPSRARA